ncbi:MAG: chemotaxis protein CheW [Oceanicaulis sp.]|nr:chemotaxis protein CheW [Oceanicaulis sp.]
MAANDLIEYVTVRIGGQSFGVAVSDIREVFSPVAITPVPRAPVDIAGLLNLRGRIVSMVDARTRLGLPARSDDEPAMALGLEEGADLYGVLVDAVGEVLRLDPAAAEAAPGHLDPEWRTLVQGVHRLDGQLLAILDIRALIGRRSALAA